MALKDILPGVERALEGRAAIPLADGPITIAAADLAPLALVPWYCDPSVQWAVHVAAPAGTKLDESALKIQGTALAARPDASLVVSIPGDGLQPPLPLFGALAERIAELPRGAAWQLTAANIGKVHRDRAVAAETSSTAGDQGYCGTLVDEGLRIESATLPLVREALRRALDVGRMAVARSWRFATRDEAAAAIAGMLRSRAANASPGFVRRHVRVKDGVLIAPAEFAHKHPSLALGLFRARFAEGPWDVRSVAREDRDETVSDEQLDATIAEVVSL